MADLAFQEMQEMDRADKSVMRLDRNQLLEGVEKRKFEKQQESEEMEEASLDEDDQNLGRLVMKREGSLVAGEKLQKAKAKGRKGLLFGASVPCGSDVRSIPTVLRADEKPGGD